MMIILISTKPRNVNVPDVAASLAGVGLGVWSVSESPGSFTLSLSSAGPGSSVCHHGQQNH